MPCCQLPFLSHQLTVEKSNVLVLSIVLRLVTTQAKWEEGVLELKA